MLGMSALMRASMVVESLGRFDASGEAAAISGWF